MTDHADPPEMHSVTLMIANTKDGDQAAMTQLWGRYFKRLVGLARARMRSDNRRAADEEDVAIIAMQSFFDGARQDRFPTLNNRTDLWRLLVKITSRQAIDLHRANNAQKRGGGHVRGESVFVGLDSDIGGIDDAIAAEVTAEFADEIFVLASELMNLLIEDDLKLIAKRKFEGYTNAEIATEMGRTERTIERKVSRIKQLWQGAE